MDIFICPNCKQENNEHQKYCVNCSTWLVNAKKKESAVNKSKPAKRSFGFVALLVIAGVVWFYSDKGLPVSANKIVFDKINVSEKYTITQLVVSTPEKPSISADLTVQESTNSPMEFAVVFYDASGARLGRATALIDKQLSSGQTTTVKLDLDEAASFSTAKSARVELTPLSPIMLLERAAQKAKQAAGK